MTAYTSTSYDSRIYCQMTMTTRKYATRAPPFHTYLSLAPIPSIDLSEDFFCDVKVTDDVGSGTSSSYVNNSEHYDNAYLNTYDNPIGCLDSDNVQHSLLNFPYDNIDFYRNSTETNENKIQNQRNSSPVLVYLENKNLVFCILLIILLMIAVIGLGVFLLNKLFRPIPFHPHEYNHYDLTNLSSVTSETNQPHVTLLPTFHTALTTRSFSTNSSGSTTPTVTSTTSTTVTQSSSSTSTTTTTTRLITPIKTISTTAKLSCPPDRWGYKCEHKCKPCGFGVCHPTTGDCICPAEIYGEFCDLWKVDDTPKRGDMTS